MRRVYLFYGLFFSRSRYEEKFLNYDGNIFVTSVGAYTPQQKKEFLSFMKRACGGENSCYFKAEEAIEDTKKFELKRDGEEEIHRFSLRRIYLWNHSSNRRALGLSWSDPSKMTIEDCALAILSRWGASENAFKHIQERHPFHYHPGFKKTESNNQQIANPEIKEKKSLIAKLNREIGRFRIELSKTKEAKNKDGSLRKNNKHTKLKKQIEQSEHELVVAREEAKRLPESIDISGLENYDSFKEIDNEGKYLFDFATSSVWNARKWMVDVLKPFYTDFRAGFNRQTV